MLLCKEEDFCNVFEQKGMGASSQQRELAGEAQRFWRNNRD